MFRATLLALLVIATPAFAQFEKATAVWTLPWDADWVTAIAFIDNTRLVAGNNIGELAMWQLPEKPSDPAPKPMRRLDGHTNTITRLIAHNQTLYSASYDHTIRVWDMNAAPTKKGVIVLNSRAIAEAESRKKKAPEPKEVAVESVDAAKTLTAHKDWVVAMSLSKDGQTLASGDEKGEVIVLDLPSGNERKRWKVKGWVYGLAISPDAQMLAVSERTPLVFDSGSHSGLKLWSVAGDMKVDLGKAFEKQGRIIAAQYSPDGKIVAVGRGGESDGMSGKATLLDPATGKMIKELTPGHLNGLTDLQFHPEGKYLATCGRDTTVRLWDVESGKMLKELGQGRGGQFKDWIHAVSFSPDGRYLAAADMAGQVVVYALAGKE